MANEFIESDVVVNAGLGALVRDVVVHNFVWRDAAGDFRGARNDTKTIRVPAYLEARSRDLRGTGALTFDEVTETSVDVTLSDHVYKGINVTDAEMTLDIVNFGQQVLLPCTGAVGRGVEDVIISEIQSATYSLGTWYDPDDPYIGFVEARKILNKARVPKSDRVLLVGSNVEAFCLESDRLAKFDNSGDSQALRDATVGRMAGFTVVSVDGLDPDFAVAFHKTAFVLSLQAPIKPDGASWGESASFQGMALRVLKQYDATHARDQFLCDVFAGSATVKDQGTLNGNGTWSPWDGSGIEPTSKLIRACEITKHDS